MICTIVLTYLISINDGAFEPRTKNLDVQTAQIFVGFLRDKNTLEKERIQAKDIKATEHAPFDCNKEPNDEGHRISG